MHAAAGEVEADALQRQARLRAILRRRPAAALPGLLRHAVSWAPAAAAAAVASGDAAAPHTTWQRVVADLPDYELRRRRQVGFPALVIFKRRHIRVADSVAAKP